MRIVGSDVLCDGERVRLVNDTLLQRILDLAKG
jgi:hypothetical protein